MRCRGHFHPTDPQNYRFTGFSSEIGTKLRESAVGQAGGSCYSRAALSSNDSKTRYSSIIKGAREVVCGCQSLSLGPANQYWHTSTPAELLF